MPKWYEFDYCINCRFTIHEYNPPSPDPDYCMKCYNKLFTNVVEFRVTDKMYKNKVNKSKWRG